MNSSVRKKFYPEQQEIVWVDFQPSKDNELRGRHPAVVISTSGYSKITGQVAVSPITHGKNNKLKSMFIPINNNDKVDGYVNPLQFHTFSILGRNIQSSSTILDDASFAEVIRIHEQILNIY
ncbi:type II toxin-antitoxin system PemK/MazF family toxin [Companilactobacillus insicii]|uniref:type II toxin-antitoxin system PemK/MazF family toxin n=1 Tax=Companilactobacillus insicii TaxID=1732567 RepID=UPI000F79A2FB|nr:type II toxin-antitoxin system PemK/MazF family toxin [Companilactobacillus insicii]